MTNTPHDHQARITRGEIALEATDLAPAEHPIWCDRDRCTAVAAPSTAGTALHPAWPPRVLVNDLAPDQPLPDTARANGYRRTPDGLLYGTPRRPHDWRFDWTGAPEDAFAPHAEQVWAVLDRLSTLTLPEAQRLVWLQPDPVSETGQTYRQYVVASYAAAETAGGHRYTDWRGAARVARWIGNVVRPEQAAWIPGTPPLPGAFPANLWPWIWDSAIRIATDTAQALLVADRPELPAAAREDLTAAWRLTFDG